MIRQENLVIPLNGVLQYATNYGVLTIGDIGVNIKSNTATEIKGFELHEASDKIHWYEKIVTNSFLWKVIDIDDFIPLVDYVKSNSKKLFVLNDLEIYIQNLMNQFVGPPEHYDLLLNQLNLVKTYIKHKNHESNVTI